ncbi:MAG: DUF502 domain-containing protein [Elusimicrobia bacterium]|nr:DUF502 domain-containing protein [Elusimicrobiota bacterium]
MGFRTVMRNLRHYLIAGLLFIGPIGISIALAYWIVILIDGMLSPIAIIFFGHRVPGLGLLSALLLLLGIGLLASTPAGRRLIDLLEALLQRIPVFGGLYRTIRQMAKVLAPGASSHFRSVVLVEYPRPGVYSLGFATSQVRLSKGEGSEELVSVYVPTNNLYIGDIILVPKDKTYETNMTLQQGIQSVFSVGTALPPSLPIQKSSSESKASDSEEA